MNSYRKMVTAKRQFGMLIKEKRLPETELLKIENGAKKNKHQFLRILEKLGGENSEKSQLLRDTMNLFDCVAEEYGNRWGSSLLFYSSTLSHVHYVEDQSLINGRTYEISFGRTGEIVIKITKSADLSTMSLILGELFFDSLTEQEKDEIAGYFFGGGILWDADEKMRIAFSKGFLDYLKTINDKIDKKLSVSKSLKKSPNMESDIINKILLNSTYSNRGMVFDINMQRIYGKMIKELLPKKYFDEIEINYNKKSVQTKNDVWRKKFSYLIEGYFELKLPEMIESQEKRHTRNYNNQINEALAHVFLRAPFVGISKLSNVRTYENKGIEYGFIENPKLNSKDMFALGLFMTMVENYYEECLIYYRQCKNEILKKEEDNEMKNRLNLVVKIISSIQELIEVDKIIKSKEYYRRLTSADEAKNRAIVAYEEKTGLAFSELHELDQELHLKQYKNLPSEKRKSKSIINLIRELFNLKL